MLKDLKFGNLKLRTKIILLALVATIVPVLIVGVIGAMQTGAMREATIEESTALSYSDLNHSVESVYRMCETQQALLLKTLTGYMNYVHQIISEAGGFSLAEEKVSWNAINPDNQSRVFRCPTQDARG